MKFKHNGTPPQFGDSGTGPTNYSAEDGRTLRDWCSSGNRNCCTGGESTPLESQCRNWSDNPHTTYEVCENSCTNTLACWGVAKNSLDGSYIKFESGSCSDRSSGNGLSCYTMAYDITKKLNIRIGKGSCSGTGSCQGMAREATNLEELIILNESCTELDSCSFAAYKAKSLKHLIINDEQCNVFCYSCGGDSTFNGALKLTEDCCTAVSGEAYNEHFDTACNYNQPSSSSVPSISNLIERSLKLFKFKSLQQRELR